MDNQEIVKRFVEANAVNFQAIGKVVGDLGPALAASNNPLRGVLIGRAFIIACMMPAADIRELVGELRHLDVGTPGK